MNRSMRDVMQIRQRGHQGTILRRLACTRQNGHQRASAQLVCNKQPENRIIFVILKSNVVQNTLKKYKSEHFQYAFELYHPIFFEHLDLRRIDVSQQHMIHLASDNSLDIGNTLVPHQQNLGYADKCLVAKLILSTLHGGLDQLGAALHADTYCGL